MNEEIDPIFHIDCSYARSAVDALPKDMPLQGKLFVAWEAVVDNSIYHNQFGAQWKDWVFRAGMGGVLLSAGKDSDLGKALLHEVQGIRKVGAILAAAQQGLGIDVESLGRVTEEHGKALGCLPWYYDWWVNREKRRSPKYRRAYQLAKELSELCRENDIYGTFDNVEVKRPEGTSK